MYIAGVQHWCTRKHVTSPRLQTRTATHMQALHRVGALMTSSPWMSHHTRGSRQDIHSTRVPVRGEAVDGPDSLAPRSMVAEQSTTTATNHNTQLTRRATNPRTRPSRPRKTATTRLIVTPRILDTVACGWTARSREPRKLHLTDVSL